MRGLKRNPWLIGRGVLLAILLVVGGQSRADVFTDQSGSIVVFPKVIADGTRDTIIHMANTSNMPAQAHCFYVNALGSCSVTVSQSCRSNLDCRPPACPTCDPTEFCRPLWEETDFDLFLTAQQPTQWRVSTGRVTDVTFPACNLESGLKVYGHGMNGLNFCDCEVDPINGGLICPGFPPGTGSQGSFAVIPVGTAFEGELKCIQTLDDFQTPLSQNSLKGEALVETIASGEFSVYNAIGISGLQANNSNNDLLLDNVEYNACPRNLIMNHYADGATDDFSGATVHTELSLVPCTELFEEQLPTRSRALFSIVNEFEQPLSAEITFDCYLNRRLTDISSQFTEANIGTQFAKTRITPPSSSICQTGDNTGLPCATNADCPNFLTTPGGTPLGCRPWTGLLGVAEEFHTLSVTVPITTTITGTAAMDLFMEGSRSFDIIVQPEEE